MRLRFAVAGCGCGVRTFIRETMAKVEASMCASERKPSRFMMR